MSNRQELTWTAPEYRRYERGAGWYVTLSAVTLLLAGYLGFVSEDWFGAVCIILFGLGIAFFAVQEPREVDITLTARSIYFGEVHVPYKQIRHFWLVQHGEHHALNVETTAWLNGHLVFELGSMDPEEVRTFLLRYVPEHHEDRPRFEQAISHRLKF